MISRAIVCLATGLLPFVAPNGATAASPAELANYRSLAFNLPATTRLVPADLNGDGLSDLLAANEEGIAVYLQSAGEQAFNFDEASARLSLPGDATGWALDGQDIIALVDGRRVLSWRLGEEGFGKPQRLLESASGLLPTGRYPMDFVRDINGDGRSDLILPGAGELTIHLQQADGGYGSALRVKSRTVNWSRLRQPENLAGQVGQNVRIPALNIRDVNNDGHMDLVSSSEQSIDVFLARPDGSFPAAPAYSVDLEALRERVGQVDFERLDYSNLSGLLAHTYEIELEDVDGDRVEDLLVREGGRITLYGGTASGMAMDKPRQVLKSSGNVLAIALKDEDGDGRKDLWLMRLQDISLANIFLWLAVSGSVDIETFVYRNEGERFASRPHRKVTLDVKFPSILSSVDLVTTALDPEALASLAASTRARLDADPAVDVAVLQEHSLAVYLNALQDVEAERFLGQSDFSRERDHYVYDLGRALADSRGNRELQAIRGREASFELSLGSESGIDPIRAGLVARDVNGDGREDFFVLGEGDETGVRGFLLLSH